MKRIKSYLFSLLIAPLLEPLLVEARQQAKAVEIRAEQEAASHLSDWKQRFEEALESMEDRRSEAFRAKAEAEVEEFVGSYRGNNLVTDTIKEMNLGEVITHYLKEECDLAELIREDDDLSGALASAVIEKLSESLSHATRD